MVEEVLASQLKLAYDSDFPVLKKGYLEHGSNAEMQNRLHKAKKIKPAFSSLS
jgi:hypothetical protein